MVAFWTNMCYINLYNKQTERNNMENTKLIQAVTNFDSNTNSVQLEIDLAQHNLQVNGRKVESITMYCDEDCNGDLAVNWEEEDDSNYVHNSSMIMRDTSDSNNNTDTMGKFYWDSEFDATLQQLLQQNGFSAAAAADVCGSEWGMQDVGRASYDAFEIANEMLAAHNLKLMEA